MPAVHSSPTRKKLSDAVPTRDRILDAAYGICARHGLHAATTREIAEEAGVNEVTLFRHFGTKGKLIAALFQRSLAAQVEGLRSFEPDGGDLREDLRRYAVRLNAMLFAHEALIRTLIGESRRHPEEFRQVICESLRPVRQRLIAYLEHAQIIGSVRKELPLPPSVDAFTGMLLAGMLRRTGSTPYLEYTQDDYLAACVELFLRGIEAGPRKDPRRRRREVSHA